LVELFGANLLLLILRPQLTAWHGSKPTQAAAPAGRSQVAE
jgi:hypothetical protein